MDILRHRPLFIGCSVLMLTVLAGFFLPPLAMWIVCGILLTLGVTVALVCFCRRRPQIGKGTLTVALALIACLGLCRAGLYRSSADAQYVESLRSTTVHVEGTVLDRRGEGGYMSSYTVEISRLGGRDLHATAYLTCHFPAELSVGDVVSLDATVLPLSEVAGDGYDATALMGDGYTVGLLSESEESLTVTASSVDLRVEAGKLRRALAARLDLLVGERAKGLPSALLLGDRSFLSDSVRRDFARAGVSHMLAISGLHMTLLFGMLALLLRLLYVPRRVQVAVLGVTVCGYLWLLGFPPSATRAAVMLGMTYLSTLLFCRADPLTSLGLAGGLILLCTPYAAADAGFWMSYLSTLGIITIARPVDELLSKRVTTRHRVLTYLLTGVVKLLSALAVGVIAMSMTLLIVSAFMGEMGVLSPLSTLLLTPLCGVILLGSLATLPLSGLGVGGLLGGLVGTVADGMTELAAWLAEPSWAVISLRHPAILPIAAVMLIGVLLLLCLRLPRRLRLLVLLPILAGWVSIGAVLGIHALRDRDTAGLTYLHPSSQSEFLVMTSGGQGFVCDVSNGSVSSVSAALREVERQGGTEIAAYMMTHYHSRTPSGLLAAVTRECIRELWLPTPTDREEYGTFRACLEIAEREGVPVYLYDCGEALRVFGELTVEMERTEIPRSTQPILLLSVENPCGDRLLYVGAATFESPLADTASGLIGEADTVILGLHGPTVKQDFGKTLTFLPTATVILPMHEELVAHFQAHHLPPTVDLWLGQRRMTLPLS